MKKIFNKNVLLWYTSLYTISTILNSIIYLIQGITEDPSGNWHELDRAIIVLIVVIGISLYRNLKIKNEIISKFCSYIITLIMALLYIFFRGLTVELASSAYNDMFSIITTFFIIVLIVNFILNKIRKK